MPEFIECKKTDATEAEASPRARLLANCHFPPGG
jgi:hypothetical protein